MGKKTIRLTEEELINLIKNTISEEEMYKEPDAHGRYSFQEFMNLCDFGIGKNFEGKFKHENGKFFVKIPLPFNPLPLPFQKMWIEIVSK